MERNHLPKQPPSPPARITVARADEFQDPAQPRYARPCGARVRYRSSVKEAAMAYDEDLADRIREALGPQKNVDEIKMFGGLCFTVNGNMAAGVMKNDLLVRVPEGDFNKLLKEPGARTFDIMKGRTPKGFMVVDKKAVATKPGL